VGQPMSLSLAVLANNRTRGPIARGPRVAIFGTQCCATVTWDRIVQ
jgi:hypothetical protein